MIEDIENKENNFQNLNNSNNSKDKNISVNHRNKDVKEIISTNKTYNLNQDEENDLDVGFISNENNYLTGKEGNIMLGKKSNREPSEIIQEFSGKHSLGNVNCEEIILNDEK